MISTLKAKNRNTKWVTIESSNLQVYVWCVLSFTEKYISLTLSSFVLQLVEDGNDWKDNLEDDPDDSDKLCEDSLCGMFSPPVAGINIE